jgi:hypothetical protein
LIPASGIALATRTTGHADDGSLVVSHRGSRDTLHVSS